MKPNWDVYYLTQCFLVAQRSLDPNTKCGAIIVSKDNRVLSQGYNGPLRGSKDDMIPLTRPEKYFHMIHSEENAILSYNGSYQDIEGSTIYITGSPCHKCLRMIIQKGIKNIVYPRFPITKCQDEADVKAADLMIEYLTNKVNIREVNCMGDIFNLFDQTKNYMTDKIYDKSSQ